METGFIKGNSSNLPKVDSLMVASFFARNKDFCAAELRNVKMSLSSRESYGDDAIGFVQLRRESDICTVKCRVCPEHKVRSKPYTVTLIVDEKNSIVISSQCHDCAASAGGCKHAVAFLMWLHRRSEEPSCTQIECYWKKSKLSKVGTTLKFITSKELAKGQASTSSDASVFEKFVEQATGKGIQNCELLKYYINFQVNNKVNIILVEFDEEYVNTLIKSLLLFWKRNIYPLLYKTTGE
ncbi:unnamed protein product [Euphydryas editha]|uniref:SWIM-type domain-containing protein n=1 Tax=Euphydryas editha TaxID=104508 RepID=A0AAU9UIX2_EUPED|nr:unnamed protein product [Euphydryas editha]